MALLLQERYKVKHLSSGDLLREAVRDGTPAGRQIEKRMGQGLLVPDDLVERLVLEHIEALGGERSFVLDGFPRTVEQARVLDEILSEKGHAPISRAIDFQASSETVIARLDGRRVCGACGANYHIVRLVPRREGVCDRCGEELQTRPDDSRETVLKRLAVYQSQSDPLLEFYRRQGKLRVISGELDVEPQYDALMVLLRQEELVSR